MLQLVVYSLFDDLEVMSYPSNVAVFHIQFLTLPEPTFLIALIFELAGMYICVKKSPWYVIIHLYLLWQHHLIIVQAPAISYRPHAVHALIGYYDFYLTVTSCTICHCANINTLKQSIWEIRLNSVNH